VREREGLITRILQLRRAAAAGGEPAKRPTANLDHDQLRALEARITHLEQLVQGLQDSVHRESARHAKQIAELEAQLRPRALSKALSKDARERGL
jgi:vacuolar-type H+-ATPase subunit I/STV1